MEIASNDGYLLQHFVAKGIPVLGIEPAANIAAAAIAKGVPTVSRFFGARVAGELAAEFGRPDLLVGNNVLAHVPDLNDFVAGLKLLLREGGTDHHGVPAPAGTHAAQPVRYDLPRALQLLLVPHGERGVRAPRAHAV